MIGKPKLRAADLFCGAGGSTTGAVASGFVDVVLAVNHWRTAVQSHEVNHASTRHICARIDDVDPRNDKTLPEIDLLIASPECTHHSNARGGQPVEDQKRATPWHVVIWTEAKRPEWVVVENVREFADWGPLIQKVDSEGRPMTSKAGRPWLVPDKKRKGETFRAWVKAIESLGYTVEWRLLNAADFGEATKRIRLFIVARRGKGRKIPWPEATHPREKWRAAAEVIDWGIPCPSIFTRKRPLKEKTLRRIEIGLNKFVGERSEPFVVKLRGTRGGLGEPGSEHSGAGMVSGVGDPLGTITAGGKHHAIAQPFLVNMKGQSNASSAGEPAPTITAHARHLAMAAPFLVPQFGERAGQTPRTHSVDDPLPAATSHGAGAVVAPYLLDCHNRRRDDNTSSVEAPLPTIVAKPGNGVLLAFLTEYYGTGGARSVDEPLSTLTAKHRHGLAMVSLIETMATLGVIDIGFRMLDVGELAAAQGFPAGYQLFGNKAERVRQIGNAVCPGVMRAICTAIGSEL